jgi:hypothetical protein
LLARVDGAVQAALALVPASISANTSANRLKRDHALLRQHPAAEIGQFPRGPSSSTQNRNKGIPAIALALLFWLSLGTCRKNAPL